MTQTLQNQTVRISPDGLYRGASVHIPYPLEHSEFLKITRVTNFVAIWAHTFFTGTAVFLITVASKWIDNKYWGGMNTISNIELTTLLILAIVAVSFEALYLFLPSEKKSTLKKIKKHFETNVPKAAGFENG